MAAKPCWTELSWRQTGPTKVSEAEGESVMAGKKKQFVPQSMMNMQVCKPFPGHNICFYIFGSPAALSSSLHLPAHSRILCSTAFSGVLLVWVCCARSRTWIWTYRKKISHPLQNRYSGESNRWEKLRMSNFILWKLYNTPKRFDLLGSALD